MLPQKNFESLRAVMAILVLFESFSGKLFDPNSECFVKYDAFCLHIFDYACLRLTKRFEIMGKLHTSKTFLKMAGGRIYIPLILPPRFAP